MNHLAMTFDIIVPYFKGFYLTLNSWRSRRDEGDWRIANERWKRMMFAKFEMDDISESELEEGLFGKDASDAPTMVEASVSLMGDLIALSCLFTPLLVPEARVRSSKLITIVYGFGDASGTGLGATFTCGSGFNFRIGVWGTAEDPESSNWKEFTNVVESLDEEAVKETWTTPRYTCLLTIQQSNHVSPEGNHHHRSS